MKPTLTLNIVKHNLTLLTTLLLAPLLVLHAAHLLLQRSHERLLDELRRHSVGTFPNCRLKCWPKRETSR